MIIAHHLVWTGYGWWLPNDPRGSTSRTIRNDVIGDLGELHMGRKTIQPASADIREFYERASKVLEHPLLELTGLEAKAIGDSFAEAASRLRYTCYACAILPDHVHLLIRKHRDGPERMIVNMQEASRTILYAQRLRRRDHPVWGGPGCKVFLDLPEEVRRTVEYIRTNPVKLGLPAQRWTFVKEYDGWLLHAGHSPKSPYATHKHGEAFRWRRR